MEPTIVDVIADKFGGQSALAEAIGAKQSTISHWKGRGDNVIPARQQLKILAAARERGIALMPADFFDLPPEDMREAS